MAFPTPAQHAVLATLAQNDGWVPSSNKTTGLLVHTNTASSLIGRTLSGRRDTRCTTAGANGADRLINWRFGAGHKQEFRLTDAGREVVKRWVNS